MRVFKIKNHSYMSHSMYTSYKFSEARLHIKNWWLTREHLKTHVCGISIMITDALVLKHQAISIHNADGLLFNM